MKRNGTMRRGVRWMDMLALVVCAGLSGCCSKYCVYVDVDPVFERKSFAVGVMLLKTKDEVQELQASRDKILGILSDNEKADQLRMAGALEYLDVQRENGVWVSRPAVARLPSSLHKNGEYKFLCVISNFSVDGKSESNVGWVKLTDRCTYRFRIYDGPPRIGIDTDK